MSTQTHSICEIRGRLGLSPAYHLYARYAFFLLYTFFYLRVIFYICLTMIYWIIFLIIYVLSFFSLRWSYRLCSSRHYRLWMDEHCRVSIMWFIPFFNTLAAITHWWWIWLEVGAPLNFIKKRKWKIFNDDLE